MHLCGTDGKRTRPARQVDTNRSHQLLSLHPTPHPAVIVTYLRHGSFYVLKDTGQQIGDEEGNGIVELWQGILGCDHKGRSDDEIAKGFWEGWEERYAALQVID